MQTILCLDPGLAGTGWALFVGTELSDAGIVRCRQAHHWTERSGMICAEIARLVLTRYVGRVVVEQPKFFDSSAGHMVARRGDLLKLMYLVGELAGRVHPVKTLLIPVNDWKGQLPKDVVERRVRRELGKERFEELKIREHAIDAVGLGLHTLGRI